jgi:hypothetical protein
LAKDWVEQWPEVKYTILSCPSNREFAEIRTLSP